jgi:uncharacterized iron-regulated membrane protein
MRRILFWSHLAAGSAAGLVILVMSVTGFLLAFERQIKAWADNRALPPVKTAGAPLAAEDLIARAGIAGGAAPAMLTLRSDLSAPAELAFGRERVLFLDPYTGAVLGEGSTATRAFFETVESWHRWLGAGGTNREFGRRVTGACNLLFLLVVMTGPFLWLPRRWNWQNVGAVLRFRSGLRGRARDWNWHNVTGIWCAVPLFFVVLTAVVMSYGWANNLLYRLAGTEPPVQAGRPGSRLEGGRQERQRDRKPDWRGLERLVARAKQQSPAWTSMSARLSPGPSLVFMIDEGSGGQPQKRAQLTLDRKTGEVVRWEPFSSNNAGRKLRTLARFVHTGEAGGWIGQAIAAVACAGAALLVWTGLALAVRRFWSWRIRRLTQLSRRRPSGDPVSGDPVPVAYNQEEVL